jgi:hypothetical protein
MAKNFFNGLITTQFKQLHADAITELVTGCAVPCQLIYGNTLFTDCVNCIYDPIGNKSSNRYLTGGPSPFTGVCPVCFGQGKIPSEHTESISLSVIYDYKSWLPTPVEVNSPKGFIQTLSVLATMDEIKEAKEIIANTDLNSYVKSRFERYGEPQPCGLGQATIIATMWKRIEN